MPKTQVSRIIGIGNLLMRDDGLGVVAIQQLRQQKLFPGVELIDGGCGGITLLQLLTECERAIIIDAADFKKKPGTILRFAAEQLIESLQSTTQTSLHQTGLAEVLMLAKKLDQLPELTLLLVQPQNVQRGLELSRPIQEALPRLCEILKEELNSWPE